MKRKIKLSIISISSILCIATLGMILNSKIKSPTSADEIEYVLEFTSEKNRILDWNNLPIPAETVNGNKINFATENVCNSADENWEDITSKFGYITNTTPIDGLKSISIQFNNDTWPSQDGPFLLYWGWKKDFPKIDDHLYKGFKCNNDLQTFSFNDEYPSYFYFENNIFNSCIVHIKYLKLVYSCNKHLSPDTKPISFNVLNNNIYCESEHQFKERKNDTMIDVLYNDNSHFICKPTRYGISEDIIFDEQDSYVTTQETDIFYSYNEKEITSESQKANVLIFDYFKMFPKSLLPFTSEDGTKCFILFDPQNNENKDKATFYYFDDDTNKYVYKDQELTFTGAIHCEKDHYTYGFSGTYNEKTVSIGLNLFYNTGNGFASGYIGDFKFNENQSALKTQLNSPISSITDKSLPNQMGNGNTRSFIDDVNIELAFSNVIIGLDTNLIGVSYKSSDPSVISIDNYGNYKALKTGKATISASFNLFMPSDIAQVITISKEITTFEDNIPHIYKDYPKWQASDDYAEHDLFVANFSFNQIGEANVKINFGESDPIFTGKLIESSETKQLFSDANNNSISFQVTSDNKLKIIETNIEDFSYLLNETIIPFIYRLVAPLNQTNKNIWVNNELDGTSNSDLIIKFKDNSYIRPYKEDSVTITKNDLVIAEELPLTLCKGFFSSTILTFSNSYNKLGIEVDLNSLNPIKVYGDNTNISELNYLFEKGNDVHLYDSNMLPSYFRINSYFSGIDKAKTYSGYINFYYKTGLVTIKIKHLTSTFSKDENDEVQIMENCIFSMETNYKIKLYFNEENVLYFYLLNDQLHFVENECKVDKDLYPFFVSAIENNIIFSFGS